MTTKVSIVIPTRNGGGLFEEVLKAISAQDFDGEVELLVVDSGSADGTVELAKKYGARVMEIDPSEFNHGLTRNLGIGSTSGEFIVLITQDAVPRDKRWLGAMVETFADESIAGVYARQIPRDDADVITKRNLNNWVTGGDTFRVQEIKSAEEFEKMTPMERHLACVFDDVCSAVRRKAWEEVPFRKNDFGEDIDWSKRVLLKGWRIAYQPGAAVVHSHDRSAGYEYRRTYMCHRKLYELFRLQTIPAIRYFFISLLVGTITDIRYILQNERKMNKKLMQCLKAPPMAFATVYGQYKGARDERLSVGVKMKEV